MTEIWTLKAVLRSWVLLISEDYELNLRGQPEDNTCIHFAQPRRVENATWANWERILPSAVWDYDVSIRFPARDENEAQAKAWSKIENTAARLSFLGSAPVRVESYGSITNAPESPVKGAQYTTIALTFDQALVAKMPPTISEEEARFLPYMLVRDALATKGRERIERSMHWLQHSHFASTPTDEFMYLMLSFEAVSHLLKEPKPHYWHCQSCEEDITECPKCGASTEWAGSGNLGMREFVCVNLGWSPKEWNEIWELRNYVFHGTQDLSSEQQQSIVKYLQKLEEAVVNALRYLLKLGRKNPPKALRQRGKFYGAKLHVKWTHNKQEGTDPTP